MPICGRALEAARQPFPIDRSLAALQINTNLPCSEELLEGARLAACDGATLSLDAQGAALFEGRIDNTQDLTRSLRIPPGRLTSAEIALLAYRARGEDFFREIIGDFSCVIWDRQHRRLVMGTDPSALRPLFYWLGDGEILVASEQRGLLADPRVPKGIDEHQLAAWLALLPRDPERSFFDGISRVAPGHFVVWERGRTRTSRWWRPEALRPIRMATQADYEQAVREALDQAVRCRLGESEAVASNLSGGLDSSSVTALAARALGEQGRRLTAFTAAPRNPISERAGWFGDEWSHAAALARMYPNIDHLRIANDELPLVEAMELREAGQDWPILNPINAIWVTGMDRVAQARGIDVMLIGATGNYSISHHGNAAFELQVKGHRFHEAFRTACALHRKADRGWVGLLREAAIALLPEKTYRRLRRLRSDASRFPESNTVANPSFLETTGLAAFAQEVGGELRNISGRDSRALRILGIQRSDHLGQQYAATRRLFGIDVRDPTSDRRLLELCLAIPEDRFSDRGVSRNLIRQAMKGLVPEAILGESRRGNQAADWRGSFDQAIPALKAEVRRLHDSPLASRALDLKRMERLLDDWPGLGSGGDEPTLRRDYRIALCRGIAAGRFVRRMEGR